MSHKPATRIIKDERFNALIEQLVEKIITELEIEITLEPSIGKGKAILKRKQG